MDLQCAGMHGQAYGNGFYFGLSDHVTLGYNREGKPGTALMCLACIDTQEERLTNLVNIIMVDTKPLTLRSKCLAAPFNCLPLRMVCTIARPRILSGDGDEGEVRAAHVRAACRRGGRL